MFAYVQLAVGDTTFTNTGDTCKILHNCDPIDGAMQHTARLKPSANTSDLGSRALESEYTYHPDNRKAGLAKLALLLIDPSDFIELHGLGTTVSWPEKEVWNASRNQTGTVRQIGMTSGYFSSQGSVSYIHNFAIRIAKQYHNPWDTMAGVQANTYNNGLWEIPPISPAGLLGLGEEDGHVLSSRLAERIFNTRRERHEAALEVLELAA